jgi:hypothetical protein
VQLRHQALSACPPRHLPLSTTIRRVWHATRVTTYPATATQHSRTQGLARQALKSQRWHYHDTQQILIHVKRKTWDLNCWRYGEFYRYHPQEELAIHKWRLWAERVWFPCEMIQVPEYETVERHLCQVSLLSLGAPQLSKNTEHMWT